jgi:hypothetical protein
VFPASCGLFWRVKRRWAPTTRTRHPLPESRHVIFCRRSDTKKTSHARLQRQAHSKKKVSIGLHDDYMTIIISERKKKFFQSQHHHPPSSRFIDEPVFATHSLSRGGHHHYYLVTFKNRHPSNRLNVSIRHHTTTPSLTASSGLRYAFHACTYISFTASFMDPSHSCMHDCVLDYRPVEFPRILCDGATGAARVLRTVGTQ